MINNSLFSSKSDEWSTPDDLFNKLDQEFHFTLDPCSNDSNFKCENHFTLFDDGLSKTWDNNVVFVNPPYSNIKEWVYKCYLEFLSGKNITIVLLIPSRTDTLYFHNYIYNICELRFLKGRLHFNNSKNPAPFPSMICIFRSENK